MDDRTLTIAVVWVSYCACFYLGWLARGLVEQYKRRGKAK